MSKAYSILYQIPSVVLSIKNEKHAIINSIRLSSADVISLSIIDDFDKATYPIIRLRLNTDITTIGIINENPESIEIDMTINENIVQLNDSNNEREYTIVQGLMSKGLHFDGYVETKNNPYSKYDSYSQGILKDTSLNVNKKVPIDIYCFNKEIVHNMKERAVSVYRNMSIGSIVDNILKGVEYMFTSAPENNEKFDQVIIPNLSRIDAIAYLDRMCGIFKSGAQLYWSPFNGMHISPLGRTGDIDYTLRVKKAGSSDDSYADIKQSSLRANVTAESLVIKTETNIEQVLNSKYIASINGNDYSVEIEELKDLYRNSGLTDITIPNIIHKTKNKFLASMYKARVEDNITHVDVSATGLNIPYVTNHTRFHIVFDEPIRGKNMERTFRPSNANHIMNNIGSGWFECTSTMRLC